MSTDPRFDAAVLAGGRSSRMGRDKALLTFEGQSLLERQVALARALAPGVVWVSGRTAEELGAIVGARALPDEHPGEGPLGGLATTLRATQAPHLLLLAVDMPALTAGFLRRLLARRADGVGVVPRAQRRWEPAVAVYPRALAGAARSALDAGRRSLHELVEAAVAAGGLAAWDLDAADERLLVNWNTPADVQAG